MFWSYIMIYPIPFLSHFICSTMYYTTIGLFVVCNNCWSIWEIPKLFLHMVCHNSLLNKLHRYHMMIYWGAPYPVTVVAKSLLHINAASKSHIMSRVMVYFLRSQNNWSPLEFAIGRPESKSNRRPRRHRAKLRDLGTIPGEHLDTPHNPNRTIWKKMTCFWSIKFVQKRGWSFNKLLTFPQIGSNMVGGLWSTFDGDLPEEVVLHRDVKQGPREFNPSTIVPFVLLFQ